jgi:RNA polymerase sigma-70 factor (ECF subfamily)
MTNDPNAMRPDGRPNPGTGASAEKLESTGDTPRPPAITPVAGDDVADLAAARAGNDAAFARLYDRHAPVVLSLCRRHAPAEAEDAAQETFIRAYRKLDKVENAEGLRSWLYAIARRVCSERSRAARRRAKHEEGFAVNRAAFQPGTRPGAAPAAADPGRRSEHAEQLQRLGAALDRLDDRERLAIHLYYLEADPVQAAASTLGLSRSGYYKLLARARDQLAALMNQAKAP